MSISKLKRFVVDLDDVVVAFVDSLLVKFNRPDLNKKSFTDWDIVKYFDIPKQVFWESLDYDFWMGLPHLNNGLFLMDFLEGKDMVFCTSPVLTSGCVQGKIDWIASEYPELSRKFCITPEKQYLANPETLLIDDREENVQKFIAAGGQAVLVPAPWNSRRDETDERGDYDAGRLVNEISRRFYYNLSH